MINNILEELKDKNIAILGFGMEGISTYKFIRKYLDIKLTIIDKNDPTLKLDELSLDNNINIIYGDNYLDNLDIYDLVIKSPGVITKDIDVSNVNFTSELELLLKYNKDNVIGITATKGKSTTVTLLYEILKGNGYDTLLLGNIGKPIFDEIDNIKEDTKIVVEMSALQLEFIDVSPHIAAIINLYEDHLDHAGSVIHYHQNKLNIFKYQNNNDYAIYCSDIEPLNSYISDEYKAIKYNVNLTNNKGYNCTYLNNNNVILNDEVLYDINNERYLIGEHNIRNIMIVLTISKILNLDINKCINIINNFHGIEHRLEYVDKVDDIIFYNDAISTIPESTINAIESLKDVDTLIFGGMDRGINYDILVDYLNTGIVRNLICMPTTGYKIGDRITNNNVNIYKIEDLKEAVIKGKEITLNNKICLLSPAASSYEYFKNFEEKGKAYKKYVRDE